MHTSSSSRLSTAEKQLDELEVDALVTACANCRIALEEGLEENEMDIPVLGLTEMLAEHLVTGKPGKEV